jgi:misacylated tRNA(Ala) deacylase
MTQLLYQTDSYLQVFDAVVTAVDEENHAVILDRTAFYPGGGGQPYDTGTLTFGGAASPVLRARKVGADVTHLLPPEQPLPAINSEVLGQLDWERRYRLMRTHTALHILCGVVFRDYGALVTGGDMDPLQGRMDFEFETMHKDLVQAIEAAVNREVANARPLRVDILPREQAFQQVRVVEIVGLDLQADGGTHVANTAEVGQIRVVDYKSKGKINKRIYIEIRD